MRRPVCMGHMYAILVAQHVREPLRRPSVARARNQEQDVTINPDDVGGIENDLVLVEIMEGLVEPAAESCVQRLLLRLQFVRRSPNFMEISAAQPRQRG